MKYYFICLIAVIVFMTGCRTMEITEDYNDDETITLPPLQAKLDYELYQARIDIHRATTEKKYTQRLNATIEKELIERISKDYDLIGVNLGNGLFLDASLNLSLDLFELIGVKNKEAFKIYEKKSTITEKDIIYERQGKIAKKTTQNLLKNYLEYRFMSDKIIVETAKSSGYQIKQKDRYISYSIYGKLHDSTLTKLSKTDNGVSIPNPWGNTEIVYDGNDKVYVGKDLIIKHNGKELYFLSKKWFGNNMYKLKRTENQIVFFNEKSDGFLVELLPDSVEVRKYNRGFLIAKKIYYIESIES